LTMAQQKEKPRCYTCKEEIYFEYGSKIPMDPATKKPHQHKKREEPKTETTGQKTTNELLAKGGELVAKEYVSLVKIVDGDSAEELEGKYELALRHLNENKCRIKGCQYRIDGGGSFRTIAIYYDMPREVIK